MGAALHRSSARRAPLGRIGEPEDNARRALFLASGESSDSTASASIANGGLLAGEPLAPGDD